MGLDMFLFKAKQIREKELVELIDKNTETFPSGIWVFEAKDVEKFDNEAMFADLMPYLSKIDAKKSCYDIDRIKSDNNIPSEARLFMRSRDRETAIFSFRWNDEKKDVQFGRDEYIIEQKVEVYVCKAEEVRYWRKAYDIQNKIHQSYDGIIENCGYYALNEDILRELLPRWKYFNGILYHEWY